MKARRRRNNKQTPFYAFTEDGKVYAGNRKAKRIARAQRALVPPSSKTEVTVNPLTETETAFSGFSVTQEETDGNDNSSSV